MKKVNKVLFFIVAVFLLSLGSCYVYGDANGNGTNNEINNVINNEITNTIVNIESITIEDVNTALTTAIDKVEEAVIGVTLKKVTTTGALSKPTVSEDAVQYGSGVIYKAEEVKNEQGTIVNFRYYVITNRHVVLADEEGNYQLYAYLGYDDVEVKANLLGYDEKVDIACFTFEYSKYIQPVEFADSSELIKGSIIYAVGNPYGYEYYGSATMGIISNTERYITSDTDGDGVNDFYCEYIQHDASINSGNSGGGLFTLDGKLIGINTLKLVDTTIDNMGFAIPSNTVKIIVTEFIEQNKPIVRPKLGVTIISVKDMTPAFIEYNELEDVPNIYNGEAPYGFYVTNITSGSTMDGSGIDVSDIILQIGDVKLTKLYTLSAKLNSLVDFQVGDEVEVIYYDRTDGKIKTTKVILKN